jgi:hypothetical protein
MNLYKLNVINKNTNLYSALLSGTIIRGTPNAPNRGW